MTNSMKQKLKQGFELCINGLLFSLMSLLNTYNANASQLDFTEIFRPLLICFFILFLLGSIIQLRIREIPKTALLLFAISILVFSYGHVLIFLGDNHLELIAKHRILVPVFVLVFLISIFFITRQKTIHLRAINHNITKILGFLLILNFIFLGYELVQNNQNESEKKTYNQNLPGMTQMQLDNLPDIYWFILDGYERKDALQDHYKYDNSTFLYELEKRDFIIPKCTLSNYTLTALTLSTALNMEYIENISSGKLVEKDQLNFRTFRELISKSQTRTILEYYGYQTVAFETGFLFTELRDADFFFQPEEKPVIENFTQPVIQVFEEEFLQTTILKPLYDMPTPIKKKIFSVIGNPSKSKYDLTKFIFKQTKDIPDIPGRKFVFIHILTPHEPFIINENGGFSNFENLSEGYVSAISATNNEMIEIIDQIIKSSNTPPIIIIQGDHAYSDKEKTKVLNVYYLPGIDPRLVTEDITPVNTFRLIFEQYFEMTLPQLDNISFLSPDKHKPLEFIEAEPTCYE